MKLFAIVAACALAGGCATVDDQIRAAHNAPTYSLCNALVTATGADGRVRRAWAAELENRGEDCSRFLGAIAVSQQAEADRQAQISRLANQLQQPRGLAAPALPDQPSRPVKGILMRNFMNGNVKVCVYDRLGTQFYVSIPPQNYCPSVAD